MLLRSRSKIRAISLVALVAVGSVIPACFWDEHKEETQGATASVAMQPAGATIKVGQTLNITAKPIDINGTPLYNKTYAWAVDDSTVVQLLPGGVAVGKKVGTTNVTATVDGLKGTTIITVTP